MNIERLWALVRQVQRALGGRRVLSGGVKPTGAVNYGAGFTVTRTGVGEFDVVFDLPFSGTPAVQFGSDNGNAHASYYSALTVAGFTAQIQSTAGANVDEYWNFTAIG